MKLLDPVSSIMSTNIVKLNIDDELTKAEYLFKKFNIRHIPVLKGSEIVGIISNTDIQRVCFIDNFDEDSDKVEGTIYNFFTLEQVMTKQVKTILPWTTIKEASEILGNSNFSALPVVTEENIVGIISTVDLLKYFVSQYKE